MIVLSQRDVVALLSMRDCIDVMGRALAALAKGEAILPLRTVMRLPDDPSGSLKLFAVMPAYVGSHGGNVIPSAAREGGLRNETPPALGAKIITAFPGNLGTDFDSHQGAVLLFDTGNGSLSAVLDGTSVTTIRTAAVSALATRHLARADADDLAIIGSGVQARAHLEAIPLVRKIRRVRLWSRDADRTKALASSISGSARIEVMPTAEEAVHGASIICTTTSSREPVLRGEWIAAGAHINAVGASTPQARELDTAAVARSRLFVDARESALKEPGDILIPIAEGAISANHIVAELGEVVAGSKRGRDSATEITLFKSLGLAVEDIAAAQHVYAAALQRKVGTVVELGGVRHAYI